MKDQILKIAKVKNEKEFYKKYPTEEAFMAKHGKALKKAAMGKAMVYDQLNDLTSWDNPTIADTGTTTPKFEFTKPESFGAGAETAGYSALQNVDKIITGIEAIGSQKKAIQKADQSAQLSGLALQAQQPGVKTQGKHPRPEDNLIQPGQLGNPYGSNTNYLSAQDGVMIGGNPTEIQNTYNPGDIYTDLGFEPMEETLKQYKKGGHMHKAEFGEYFQDSGQAQLGEVAGEAIGSAFGPAGKIVGKYAGKVLGNLAGGIQDARKLKGFQDQAALNTSQAAFQQNNTLGAYRKNGGWISNDWEPQVIAKFGDYDVKDLLKPPHDADMLRSGGHLAQVHYTPPSAEALFTGRPELKPLTMNTGGRLPSTNMMFDTDKYPRAEDGVQMAMGGDLQVGEGGYAETLSYNPHLPGGEIGMFRGASHDNGGIKTKYGENEVEVEGGEPVVKLKDGGKEDNLVVFGNIKINKKIADLMGDPKAKDKKFKTYIADVAKNDAKQVKRMTKALDLIENSDENSSFDHLSLNTGRAMLEGATAWQKINAEKIKQAGIVQDAIHQTANQLGVKSDKLAEGKLEKETDPSMMGKNGKKMKKAQNGFWDPITHQYITDMGYPDAGGPDPLNAADQEMIKRGMSKPGFMGVGATELPEVTVSSSKRKRGYEEPIYAERKGVPLYNIAPEMFTGQMPDIKMKGKKQKKPINWGKVGNVAEALLSNAAPWLRPSNANEPLNPDQLYPEYFALANNQVKPVQAQTFQPMLDTPFDISANDQLNAIDAQSRAFIRTSGNNPAAQAAVMAQTIEAKNKVLGEYNRINQANKMQVYDKNRALLNDAQLKNLQILDQQYVRQSQAESNTKAQALAALSSIAAKTAQQRATNRKLAVLENMYNFRFSPSGRAYNANLPYQFDLSGSGKGSSYEAINNMLGKNKRITTDPTTGEVVGIRTLTRDEMSGNSPSLSEIDNYLEKNGGKTPKKKSARNSSIVKALKNL